jgi:uncharacterized protein (DUF4415 family)
MKNKLTEMQKRDIARIAAMPESKLDTSDIPPLGEDFFRNAVRNPYFKPVKSSTTVRIDADVLAWLKSQGRGYQTRINGILRAQMLKELKPGDKAPATPA